MEIFEEAVLGNAVLKNRIIRSATFEGMCDENGFPGKEYFQLYRDLAKNNIGAIITGFAFISKDGRAMQPGQAGMDSKNKIPAFLAVTNMVHQHGTKIFMQITHTGRQTSAKAAGGPVRGVSKKKSFYFNEKPSVLSAEEIDIIIEKYADSAYFCREAGFDGIQIHAAHGYLVHQFILPSINNRKDIYGIDPEKKIGTVFLDKIIDKIREKCGADYPVLVKISGSDDYMNKFGSRQFVDLVRFLDRKKVSGIEVSYGTMDYALNIFRGSTIPFDAILDYNPRYKTNNNVLKIFWKIFAAPVLSLKLKPFRPHYNLPYARLAKANTAIPVICVGGFRSGSELISVLKNKEADFVSLSRPFVCESDFALKVKMDRNYQSRCINCNICAIMCDSIYPTRCYSGRTQIKN